MYDSDGHTSLLTHSSSSHRYWQKYAYHDYLHKWNSGFLVLGSEINSPSSLVTPCRSSCVIVVILN